MCLQSIENLGTEARYRDELTPGIRGRAGEERRSIPKIDVNVIAVILHKLGSFQ